MASILMKLMCILSWMSIICNIFRKSLKMIPSYTCSGSICLMQMLATLSHPIFNGVSRILLLVAISQDLFAHIFIFFLDDVDFPDWVIHAEQEPQLFFLAQLHLLLLYGGEDGSEVGHDGSGSAQCWSCGPGPFAKVRVVKEHMVDFGSHLIKL